MTAPERGMNTELAAAMPWLTAEGDSMWEIDGTKANGTRVFRCLARVLPEFITGGDCEPQFEVLSYLDSDGAGGVVPAHAVTRAVRLLLVLAGEPRTAYFTDDQVELDVALERTS